jgi:hypothetical protein
MREELLKIVYWKDGHPISKPLASEKVEAAKNVIFDLAILNAEAAWHVQEPCRGNGTGIPLRSVATRGPRSCCCDMDTWGYAAEGGY